MKIKCTKISGARKSVRRRAKKVLVKGDPGIGKTSLLKRIASDWAKGIFTAFSLVFFVFLKLVKPGDGIENVIIDQMPVLEGMGVTHCKLMDIIETLGNRCLLILDSLDEHELGENQDVQKIFKGQKLLYTNIILSSRPQSTREIEKYFLTVVRVEGFTDTEAYNFAFKILNDRNKASAVLSFNPPGIIDRSLQHSPILLSVICFLVREENFVLSGTGPDVGDLYTRMARCLYKKFTILKNFDFSVEGFISTMISIGKLALETLVSGNPLMQRSRVIKEIGEDAFNYGLLIGHEDFRLIRDETADIFIAFSHRSIQEYLGALFFIFSLNEGETVPNLLGSNQKSIFFTNPLFLHFCLWLLYSDQDYFPLTKKFQARETLRSYVLKIFRNNEFITSDIAAFYPKMNVREAFERKDALLRSFLGDALSHYNEVKILVLESTDPTNWILTSMRPVLSSIQHLFESSNLQNLRFIQSHMRLNLTHFHGSGYAAIQAASGDEFEMLKRHFRYFNIPTCLSLRWGTNKAHLLMRVNDDSSERIMASVYIGRDSVISFDVSALCAYVTEFFLSNYSVNEALVMAFANAVTLPALQKLGFTHCKGMGRKLTILLQCRFPSLSALNLFRTNIDASDLQALSRALNNEDRVLPQLTSLIMTVTDDFEPIIYFSEDTCRFQELFIASVRETTFHERLPWSAMQNLKRLGLSNISRTEVLKPIKQLRSLESLILSACIFDKSDLNVVTDIAIDCKLTHLDISDNTGIRGKLSILLDHTYPSLDMLVLNNCKLTEQELESLPLASVGGRLPKLKHLDISGNQLWNHAKRFFSNDCKWDNLISIDVTDDQIDTKKSGFIVQLSKHLSSGSLRLLQELTFTDNNATWSIMAKCEQLQTLRV